ncbi:MAG: hypothetical protein QM778_03445 [Myxococcales bacterium]
MNAHLLIDAVVQQTMVFIAELATAGGVRAPLAGVAEQVFLDLTRELAQRGVKKKVIADMFGMALRTYHRRLRELSESRTVVGKTVWEAVLEFVREREPVSGRAVLDRFAGDDPEVVSGVLSDLSHSGLIYRAGRGDDARYRIANEADFGSDSPGRSSVHEHLVWLTVYRNGPCDESTVQSVARLGEGIARACLERLAQDGRVRVVHKPEGTLYAAERFEVPVGAAVGWEAAVFDHYQALVTAVITKLKRGSARGEASDHTGGSTWTLEVWPGHPLELEAKTTLRGVRAQVDALRARVDAYRHQPPQGAPVDRVVFYAGQYVRAADPLLDPTEVSDEDHRE